jgi:large subunit ribosomal protein L5
MPSNNLIFKHKNMNQAYKNLEKIVVNVGVGRLSAQPHFDDKILPEVMNELALITGQKPMTRLSRKSIAGFKLRMGTTIGLKVTLRGNRMKDFLERLIRVVLPRVKDFRGLDSKSVDSAGNLTIGFKEHLSFPEITADVSKVNFGLEVTLVPKMRNKEKAVELYRIMGLPFKKHG